VFFTRHLPGSQALRRTAIPAGPPGEADPASAWTGRAIIAVNLLLLGRPDLAPRLIVL